MVSVGPPKRPRGGFPAFATRFKGIDELVRAVQDKVAAVRETDKGMTGWRSRRAYKNPNCSFRQSIP